MPAQPAGFGEFQQTSPAFGQGTSQSFMPGWGNLDVSDLSELEIATDILNIPMVGEPMPEIPADMADIFNLTPVD